MARARFEKEWTGLGYAEGMGSAFSHPPSKDFIRAYHLTSAEHGINAISLSRLKVARFSEVNDPFEVFAVNFHERKTRKLVRRFKDSHNSKTGLLCFSANWSNSMIWSHYATKHKGICLGFDLRRKKIRQVQYVDERIRAKLTDNEDSPTLPAKLEDLLLRTKARYWQYEEEIRVFVDLSQATREQGLYFWSFDNDMRLAEVILGPLSELPLPSIRKLTEATNPNAVAFKSRLAFRSFKVVPDGRYLPQIS